MERYFRLKKQIPGTIKLTDLIKLDDKGWVYKSNKDNQLTWIATDFKKQDIEMTEYFEESVGMSADKYVLFKGDTVYKNIEEKIESFNVDRYLRLEFVYYKKENVPVNTLPKTWEDLKEISGYFVSAYSSCNEIVKADIFQENKNIFHTELQAKSVLAYAQLSQLVAKMNGNWQPNFNDSTTPKWLIVRWGNDLTKEVKYFGYSHLCFKNKSDMEFSFEYHKSLWKQFYQIEE